MKAYVVGGAVRDGLLGVPVNDRDWVVVGARPEELLALGYRPVGRDFPVFLHPLTSEEVALARTERKSAAGYHGFQFHAAPDVTLEQDLARRDLTINAMALDPDTGALIDPFGGRADLQARVFRHISPAFAEDPVRLLRIARFGARWPDFSIAPETQLLMHRLVDAGEVDALVAERVWQEVSRGLMERSPARLFQILHDCGALARLAPELAPLWSAGGGGGDTALALAACAEQKLSLAIRYACLCHQLGGGSTAPDDGARALTSLSDRWRVGNDCRELATALWREQALLREASTLDGSAVLALLERCDAFRRPERFGELLSAFRSTRFDAAAATAANTVTRLATALDIAQRVQVATLREQGRLPPAGGPAIGLALRAAREQAIAQAFAGT